MPHLSVEYSGNLEGTAEVPGLLAALRDAMVATGVFPLGGVRVRAFRADHWVIADGAGAEDGFVAMALRMGEGRDAQTRARAREAVYAAAEAWLGHRKGGLAMAAIGASAGFGAVCGSSLATASSMGKVALPELRRAGYSGALSTGALAAGGTLGILLPPSVVLVV